MAASAARSATGTAFAPVVAPDISGYGSTPRPANLPMRLAEEVDHLGATIENAEGPLHLVGHSYGGAIAFKIATTARFADRVRSLTLIEPVLPTLLKESPADSRLHDLFAQLARNVSADLWNGMYLEATALPHTGMGQSRPNSSPPRRGSA